MFFNNSKTQQNNTDKFCYILFLTKSLVYSYHHKVIKLLYEEEKGIEKSITQSKKFVLFRLYLQGSVSLLRYLRFPTYHFSISVRLKLNLICPKRLSNGNEDYVP